MSNIKVSIQYFILEYIVKVTIYTNKQGDSNSEGNTCFFFFFFFFFLLNLSYQQILQLLKVITVLGLTLRHCHKRFVE